MAEDIFDVVDANDEVVFSAPRSEVHAKKLMHRAGHVIIFSGEGAAKKILLQKRSMQKDLYPGRYTTSCSGHIDSGETYEMGTIREMAEETGIRCRICDMNFVGKISPCAATGNEFTAVYEMSVDDSVKLTFLPEEIEGFEWVVVSDFENMILENPEKFTPSFLCVYGFYLSKRK